METHLRQTAVERIKAGTAPVTRGWPAGAEALTMLHRLASVPASASGALKLLHELQVHQVELDLQHEQAQQDRQQLTDELAEYTALFDAAPFADFTLEPDGVVVAANHMAIDWIAPEAWVGRHIDDLLAPEDRTALRGARQGGWPQRAGRGDGCVWWAGVAGLHARADRASRRRALRPMAMAYRAAPHGTRCC